METRSRQYYLFVILLGSLTAFGPLSIDMYLPALPAIADSFGVGASRIELSLTAFFAGLCIGQVFYGPLSDRFGRKVPIYSGLIIYILASIACALSMRSEQLIFARFLQAIGGCAGMVITRAMVRDLFDHRQTAQVFSLLMLVMGVAPIIAPVMGGLMLTHYGWASIFWMLAALAVICLAVVALYLPETKAGDKNVKFSRIFHTYGGITQQKDFMGYTLASGFASAGMFAYITGSPVVLITYFGLTPSSYGLLFGINAAGLIAMSQVNGWLLRRYPDIHPDTILDYSTAALAFFSVLLMAAGVMQAGFMMLALPLFGFLACLGMIYPNAGAGAMQNQKTHAGAASSLMGVIQCALAAMTSSLVSYFHQPGAFVMTMIVGVCGLISFVIYHSLRRSVKKHIKNTQPPLLPQ